MLINLFQTIRSSGVPCTVRELLDLLGALENQLVYANIDDFYYLSRATLVKDEKYYDRFDRAFGAYFKNLENKFQFSTRQYHSINRSALGYEYEKAK